MTEQEKRRYIIETAIGLQAVDGLHVSDFFLQQSERYISGEITLKELGEIVRDSLPLGLADTNSKGEIVKDFGNYDNSSLKYEVKKSSNMYLGSDLLEEPYFVEDDAKNGDIISLYVYVPLDGNVSSLQLEVFPSSMNNSIKYLS